MLKGKTVIPRIQNVTGQIKQKETHKTQRPEIASNQICTAHITIQQQNQFLHTHLEHQDSLSFIFFENRLSFLYFVTEVHCVVHAGLKLMLSSLQCSIQSKWDYRYVLTY